LPKLWTLRENTDVEEANSMRVSSLNSVATHIRSVMRLLFSILVLLSTGKLPDTY